MTTNRDRVQADCKAGLRWRAKASEDMLVGLRVTREEERLGLDLSQHGETVGESASAAAANAPGLELMGAGESVPVRT